MSPLMRGISKGQFLILRRNCSDVTSFRTQSEELAERLMRRGYPKKIVKDAYEEALKKERSRLLIPQPGRKKEGDENLRIIGQYDTHSYKVK